MSPVVTEIVEGALRAAEEEMEESLGRAARSSPMRDLHDFRASVSDRFGNKLLGRSCGALVEPVLEVFPREAMRPGDIFLHNDPYLAQGGRLAELCLTAPVFAEGAVLAFVQVCGAHEDVGGQQPGSLPTDATEAFHAGTLLPPVRLYDAGEPCGDILRVLLRNSRAPEELRADLISQAGACRRGSARLEELLRRYGPLSVGAAFADLLASSEKAFREELLGRLPGEGEWQAVDYVEEDGAEGGRPHPIALALRREGDTLIVDFSGTGPQAPGPINLPGERHGGKSLKRWLAPLLRHLAESPERAQSIPVNDGACRTLELRFPPPGSLLTPLFPAPTHLQSLTLQRLLSAFGAALAAALRGRTPADLESLRTWGLWWPGEPGGEGALHYRESLGGGAGARPDGDGAHAVHILPGARVLPVELAEARYPVLVERMGLLPDSGGAGRFRGGLGCLKDYRVLRDGFLMSAGDRSRLAPWGACGGRGGGRYAIALNPGSEGERVLPGLVSRVPVRSGEVVRVATTGGGGWGDPFERPPQEVRRDVLRGFVSAEEARGGYGVSVKEGGADIDPGETARLRSGRRRRPPQSPFAG